MPVMLWIALAVVLALVEISTAGFFCIFFAVGALISAIVAWFLPSDVSLQVVCFFVGAIISLIFLRPVLKESLKISDKPMQASNVQALIGKPATVIDTVEKFSGKVKVQHTGEVWSAFLSDESASSISVGQEVVIERIEGAKLAVSAK
jgi:membrane protein implicated in regulation of membrane protease activity